MPREHSVKSFDQELTRLNHILVEMAELAASQTASAIDAITQRDADMAARVVATDVAVNRLEREVEDLSLRMLALRQPVAADLRNIVIGLRMSVDFERVADYARNMAEKVPHLGKDLPQEFFQGVVKMGDMVKGMIHELIEAFEKRDAERAVTIWFRDDDVDELYFKLITDVRNYMAQGATGERVKSCTHLLSIIKGIERMGDHLTNIAEHIHFLVRAKPLNETVVKSRVRF
jgi:phosphate transport system protein